VVGENLSLVVVVMAGGVGTRFWPLSTSGKPKQFLKLFGDRSLLQSTYDRVASLVPPERTLILTNDCFRPMVREQLPAIPPQNVIGEPERRDTAAAVALAAFLCHGRYGDPVMAVLPADHMIHPVREFHMALWSAARAAHRDDALYTFGIPPTYSATGYGYIELGEQVADDQGIIHFTVASFKEKPDLETANAYLRKGNYLWNSGMFVWKTSTVLAEIEKHLPVHYRLLRPFTAWDGSDRWAAELQRAFVQLPKISIDYGVMEKAAKVRVIVAPFAWSDVGGWLALEDFLEKDDLNNAFRGRLRVLDAGSNIVFCADQDETIALLGVKDLILVRSGKRTLVANRERAEEVKQLVESFLANDEIEDVGSDRQEAENGREWRESSMDGRSDRISCFKAYDIRGRVPEDLNEDLAYAIGRAYAALVGPRRVAVGHDVRLSSPALSAAVIKGLTASGVDVCDIGLCGTEQVYFATFALNLDGGIMVTASHNPAEYNGMKLVREKAKPISGDSGLREIERLVASGGLTPEAPRAAVPGKVQKMDIYDLYVDHLLQYIDPEALQPFKVVCNAGNGGAGLVIERLEKRLPLQFVKLYFEPDGRFPNGVPNPLLPENRRVTAEAVVREKADLGIAWDGDYDRCFLFDEKGTFIEGYYMVGLLARHLLAKHPGAKIIHDPRLTWNTIEVVQEAGGIPVQSKTGHAFIKERMRAEDAVYGGEMSAHHYFRDFAYCDSGMIPWLIVLEIMSRTGKRLSELVGERMQRYPISGEINRRVDDPAEAIARIRARYAPQALAVDETDGVSVEFERWRFNLRMSNTEPVVRLNVESRGDAALVEQKTREILFQLDNPSANN